MSKDNSPDASVRKNFPAKSPEGQGGPQEGARQMAGKSSMPTAALRTGLQPKPEAVREAKCDEGAARRCINQQLERDATKGTSSSGKERPKAIWGVPADDHKH
jgi:hypothetical protein